MNIQQFYAQVQRNGGRMIFEKWKACRSVAGNWTPEMKRFIRDRQDDLLADFYGISKQTARRHSMDQRRRGKHETH